MSWWKQQLKDKNGEIRHKVNKLRVNYLDLLTIEEEIREMSLKQETKPTPEKPTPNTPKIETIATLQKEQEETKQELKQEESKQDESSVSSEKDVLSTLPEKIRPWIKKVYYHINLQYHPDKCQNSPLWFKDWLSSYQRADWLQFILFTDNVEKIWEIIPPPEEIYEFIETYYITCLRMIIRYQQIYSKQPQTSS